MFAAVTSSVRQDGDASGQEGERECRGLLPRSGSTWPLARPESILGPPLSLRREESEVTCQRGDSILALALGMCSLSHISVTVALESYPSVSGSVNSLSCFTCTWNLASGSSSRPKSQ